MNNVYSIDYYRYYKTIILGKPLTSICDTIKERIKNREKRDKEFFKKMHNDRVKESYKLKRSE